MKNMSQEIEAMVKFDHPNVMSLIGVCVSSCQNRTTAGLGMIMPLMENGSLLDYLRNQAEELVVNHDKEKVCSTFE